MGASSSAPRTRSVVGLISVNAIYRPTSTTATNPSPPLELQPPHQSRQLQRKLTRCSPFPRPHNHFPPPQLSFRPPSLSHHLQILASHLRPSSPPLLLQ
ncbi:unnamed protein product [Hydatigera taeniaeformis]|uniref:Uncharacterized protein n=1 Tax=Hydatigena taeniaeformis TaxID=6205 RepID=A0A3P7G809_HYDTA|nr:unnamed protein product [Hydatigera taeniaeformis]